MFGSVRARTMDVDVQLHTANSFDEDNEEQFLTDCENLAKELVALYLDRDPSVLTKGPLRAPSGGGGVQPSHDPVTREVAQRLKSIGDDLERMVDAEMDAIMTNQSVFDMGLPQFTRTCREVLARCSGRMTSGWQQVHAVYYSVIKVVRELRQQSKMPEPARKQREDHMLRFAGPVMQDLGLDCWVQTQGGLKKEPKITDSKVAII